MQKFIVFVREVHVQGFTVIAKNEEEAKDFVREGRGDIVEDSLEYSHALDSELWTVEKFKKPKRGRK